MTMASDDEPQGNMGISAPDDGRLRKLCRAVTTLLIIAVILLVGLCFVVPTDGVKSVIENKLSDRVGVSISIDSARIGWPYVLVIEGAVSDGFDIQGRGGFKAREIRIGRGWKTSWVVTVDRAVVRLTDTSDDRWVPEIFARLGPVPMNRIDEVSRVTEGFRRKVALRVSDSTVIWTSGVDGGTLASAYDVVFSVEPVGVPGRDMYHHELSVDRATHMDGTEVNYVGREWLASEVKRYIEVHRSGKGVPGAVGDFWNPPHRDGEETSEE